MQDNSIKILLVCLIILGVFLGAYEGLWRQGAKKVLNYETVFSTHQNDIYLVLIWDASESMWEKDFGVEKILQSKEVLMTFVDEMPDDINIALRIFGARRTDDLKDSFLAVPLQDSSRENMINFITNVRPLGKSSIAHSLNEARMDLHDVQGDKYMILISDGIDYGDIPTKDVINKLIEDEIVLHVVHIGDSNEDIQNELKGMVEKTGGDYFSYNEQEKVVKTIAR
ncbi:vWA domain-containing protein [Natronospora cellulosivora (SeqCode)]